MPVLDRLVTAAMPSRPLLNSRMIFTTTVLFNGMRPLIIKLVSPTIPPMKTPVHPALAGLAALLALSTGSVLAQRAGGANAAAFGDYNDHEYMKQQLGITGPLRPGARGSAVNDPNYANYDETKARAKTPVPPLLAMADGRPITTPAQWEQRRKELFELFDRELYGRLPEAAKTIKVTWEVTNTTQGMSGNIPTITRTLVGHVDPTYYPAITINIGASVTTPANAAGKVPVIITWGGGGGGGGAAPGGARGAAAPTAPVGGPAVPVAPVLAGQSLPTLEQLQTALTLTAAQADAIRPILEANLKAQQELTDRQKAATTAVTGLTDRITASAKLSAGQKMLLAQGLDPSANNNPPFPNGAGSWQQAALSLGWGYGSLNPGSIQADSGGNALRQGIIGLINKGQPRKPDDWGALRAWAWGAGRLIDFFEQDTLVDAKQVAFEGHSRYGKATIATLVYEPRAFTGFVSSSGEGGAKLWRHLVGEQVENLASWNTPSSEYHWMAGNFLKYAGPLTVDDLPVDNHQFVALVAPRPIFVSGGEYIEFNGAPGHPESHYSGESWQDTPGTFMATAGASPVWKLLGKKPLSNDLLGLRFDNVPDAYDVLKRMPPPLTPLIDGDIAFRQHGGGHTDAPNWSTFMIFLTHHFKSPGLKN